MADDSRTKPEEAFHKRLLAAAAEVKQHTRAGVRETVECIQSVGGLQAAKERLRTVEGDHLFASLVNRPGEFFWAAKRVGRMDLSIEAIVLEPGWSGLFTPSELDCAASRLKEHGFNPPLERLLASETSGLAQVPQSPFSKMSFRGSRSLSLFESAQAECELTAEQSIALREGRRPNVSPDIRRHLNGCSECRRLYPALVAAYEHFDQEALEVWIDLLKSFQLSLLLEDTDLKRFMVPEPEDYDDSGDFEVEVEEVIRPVCAWRAIRLGCHIGRFMLAFSGTYGQQSNLWLKWRRGDARGAVSDFVRSVDRDLFALGLAARNLLLARYWPEDAEDILWLPADEDLSSIPGLVHVDEVQDLDDWEEVLGKAPEDLNPMGVLYLATRAAVAEMEGFGNQGTDVTAGWVGLQEQLAGLLALAQSHQASLDDIRAKQDAEIDQLLRMANYMSSTDRHSCEQALMFELPGIYQRLEPQVRCLLLAAEQIYRTRDFAAPGELVHAFATAFEVQVRSSLLPKLLEYLKSRKTPNLHPLTEWIDVEHGRPVYSPNLKAEKLSLGNMKWLFRHPETRIDEFFELLRLKRVDVSGATDKVYEYRNSPAHGRSIDIGTAEAIRNDWLRWGGNPGGVFAVLFASE